MEQDNQFVSDRVELANKVREINQSYFGTIHGYDVKLQGDTWQVLELFGDINDPHYDIVFEGTDKQALIYLDGMSMVMRKMAGGGG